jgi:hypothetical protein
MEAQRSHIGSANNWPFSLLYVLSIMPILAYMVLALTLGGCTTTRSAYRYDASSVKSISVYRDQLPHSSEDKYVGSITNRDQIKEIVACVNKYQQGWKPCLVSPAAGKIVVEFFKNDGKPSFHLRICPRAIGGEIQMEINGEACWHELPQADKEHLLALLGVS